MCQESLFLLVSSGKLPLNLLAFHCDPRVSLLDKPRSGFVLYITIKNLVTLELSGMLVEYTPFVLLTFDITH